MTPSASQGDTPYAREAVRQAIERPPRPSTIEKVEAGTRVAVAAVERAVRPEAGAVGMSVSLARPAGGRPDAKTTPEWASG